MNSKFAFLLIILFLLHCCAEEKADNKNSVQKTAEAKVVPIPATNQKIIETVKKYGPAISPTYEKAVCTELVIQILEKEIDLTNTDKSRIRIITNDDIQQLLQHDSNVPKGVYYALTEKGAGIPVDEKKDVIAGDFVQFWTETWGHCGIVESIDLKNNKMKLYSSFPSTDGYGIQDFEIPKYSFFVRLK